MPTPPRRRWFQFSLATIFVVVTVLAVVAHYFAHPTILANRFVLLMEAREYDEVDKMFCQSSEDDPIRALWRMRNLDRSKTTVELEPLTVGQFVSRHRHVRVDLETIGGSSTSCNVTVTTKGLESEWSGFIGITLRGY